MATDLCAVCPVRDDAVCGMLSDIQLAPLNSASHHRSIAMGATVMWAGDDSAFCGNVLSGVLKITAATADGREQIVGLLYESDFLGQPQPGELRFSVTAVTKSELCMFPRMRVQSALDQHISMERMLMRRTQVALDEARSRMLLLARGTAQEKLAGFLVEMSDRVRGTAPAQAEAFTIELPLSRGQIADVLGLTIETVSRQMTHLRTAGIIALPGGRAITVCDATALKARAICN